MYVRLNKMKYIILSLMFVLTSCNQKELKELRAENNNLRKSNETLQSKNKELSYDLNISKLTDQELDGRKQLVRDLMYKMHHLHKQNTTIKKSNGYLQYLAEGNRPTYFITIKFKKSRMNPLDFTGKIKDEMNAFEITIPVSKEYYDQQKVGQRIASKFKTASFFTSGKLQSLNVTIVKKWESR